VGVREQETRLVDGGLYDVKEYEILADRYLGRNKINGNTQAL
jgi:hypothetical protein